MDDKASMPPPRAEPIRAAAAWHDLLLVCRKCQKKQATRGGDDGLPLRKWLKRALKSQAAGARLRVVDCGCLDLCPKRGVTLALARELDAGKPLRVLRDGEDRETVMRWLARADAVDPRASR